MNNSTHKQKADALYNAVKELLDGCPLKDRILVQEWTALEAALADYEAAQEQGPEPAPDLIEAAKREYPRDKNLLVQLKKLLLEHTGHNEIKGPVSDAKIAQPPQPEAKPGDWMRAADNLNARANQLIDIYNYGDQHEQQKARELLFDAKESYYAVRSAHCQNAGDAREITAKELISRLADFHGNGSPLMNMARMALKDIQSERATREAK